MKYSMVCLGVLLMAACATPPPRPTSVDPAITGEVDKAIASPGPQETRLPQQALLPPLRMEMPSVEGRPIDSRFDLSVSNAPAAQVFMAIASGTRYSMLLNPGITGLITVNLKDVTVREALDSLRELYGHDYRIEGNRIFVQAAGLQTKIYRVNYLLGQRRGTSDLRVQSGSLADSSAPSGPPTPASTASPVPSTGSGRAMDSTRVTTSIFNDFWGDLRTALTAIVGTGDGRSVVVTPQSGVVLVRAFPTELRSVESYLRETRLVVERQVMLEAKVIEVTLAEGFQSGINWGLFRTHDSPRGAIGQIGNNTTLGSNISSATLSSQGITVNPAAGTLASAATLAGNGGAVFGLAFQTSNFAALLQFLDSQGTTQVLSSPRIATLNNQKAVLKVGTDEFFVTNVATVTTTTGTTTQQTPTVTVAPFFSGIMLDVTPQIDQFNNITLHIHPSISEVTESRRVVDLGGTIPSITLPLAKSAVNESDTVVRVTDGNIVAIGGLMSVDVRDGRTGIPGVADSNVLLRNSDRQARKREIVILLKPTVIQNDASWGQDLRETRERLERFIPRRPPQEAGSR
ncbi:MAG TPA: secretin N-terminal domain-containing protein [Burkholderiales bacterium]|nr:secretin N-terminal domain-containing protein [Burkholderiales bacterium]